MSLFYKPKNAWLGDPMTFYEDEEFKIFYLHDKRDWGEQVRGGHWGPISCYLISTKDFINFKEYGEVIPRGSIKDQDYNFFSGSIIKAMGNYHFFYTGHNPYFQKECKPGQAIMHAISKDLINWKKIPGNTLYANSNIFEILDWRDPFIFWNEGGKVYWMLLTARKKEGLSSKRGCIALYISKDLKTWRFKKIFWEPNLYINLEVPELLKIGDYYYLIYSTYNEKWVSHYRVSHFINGPWSVPYRDTFDGSAFYAAKTISNGKKIYVLGWIPTRFMEKDYEKLEFGGNLITHELVQESDGTLSVKIPEGIDDYFQKGIIIEPFFYSDNISIKNDIISIKSEDSFSFVLGQEMPKRCKISGQLKFSKDTKGCGFMLRASEDLEKSYYIRIEPDRDRMVLDSWPRDGWNPYKHELERPVKLTQDKIYEVKIIVEDTICIVYLDNKVAMSTRIYDHKNGRVGVFVKEGITDFFNLRLWV